MRQWLFLPGLRRHEDVAYLMLRLLTGCFLVYGVWDNITSFKHMQEFTGFLRLHHFPLPAILAPFSVYTQFLAGIGLIVGLFTRWSGLLILATFIVAVIMVHWNHSFREWWPAAILVALGAYFAAHGGGRYSLDHLMGNK